MLLAAVVVAAAVRHGVFVAAGADSYGYVSQARLWARGELRVPQPIARQLPADVGDELLAPLGYRPARIVGLPGGIVPTYSPGLPMLMAGFKLAAGEQAVYYVVPLLAGASVLLTYLFGMRLGGPAAGLVAAVLLAASPAFLASALRPMSDLPVAFWWTLALTAAAGPGLPNAAVAGLATSLAVLTRPNLLLLGLVVIIPMAWDAVAGRRDRVSRWRLALYAATAVIGPVLVAAINAHLYGAPLRSGYGALEDIYAIEHVWPNLQRYPAWFSETQTPLLLLALVAPLFVGRGGNRDTRERGAWTRARLAWASLALVLLTFASYVAYMPFEEWLYLRFLLPAYPALFALFASLVVWASSRVAAPARVAILVAIAGGLAVHGVRDVWSRGVTGWQRDDQRYVIMGRFVRERLPQNAILFAMQHSGSARHYSGRLTLRYDLLDPERLDPLVEELAGRGYPSYVLLESWEVIPFRHQFRGAPRWGRLDWPPMAATETPTRVYLYDLRQRGAPPAQTIIVR